MKLTLLVAAVFSILFTSNQRVQYDWKEYRFTGKAQGTSYSILLYSQTPIVSSTDIDSIFQSIDASLSLYKSNSLINYFNESKRGCKADSHLRAIYLASVQINKSTKGISDLSIGAITDAWGLAANKPASVPDKSTTAQLMNCVGMKKLYLKGDSLIKSVPCLKLDPNGIAQGYTVDMIASFIESRGINNYLIEVGGETRWNGQKMTTGKPFVLALESIQDDVWEMNYFKILLTGSGSITTSGNYRKYKETAGKLRSHAFGARTGLSAKNSLIAVTVFAKTATTADGYDNALLAMGLTKGVQFIKEHPYLGARFIYTNKRGQILDSLVNWNPLTLVNK